MRLLTLREVSERVGLSEVTLRRKVREGSLPVKRLGRSIRVEESALAEWIEAQNTWSIGHMPVPVVRRFLGTVSNIPMPPIVTVKLVVSYCHDNQEDFDCSPQANGFPGLVSQEPVGDYCWEVVAEAGEGYWEEVEEWRRMMAGDAGYDVVTVSQV